MKIVSLFSGAGGLDLGLTQAGHEVVWANDIFEDAIKTYQLNIGNHIDSRDIQTIQSPEIPDCDVIVGGFPCQGYSVANWTRKETDPRNQLYKEMVRIIKDKQPKFFIGENVKGLVSIGQGKVLNTVVSEFGAAGYNVQFKVLNAADYGVPQQRQRLIIFGTRKDFEHVPEFPPVVTHADKQKNPDSVLKPWVTVGEALAHFPEPEEGMNIPNHQASKYKLRFNGHIGHRVINPDKPSPTITARGDDKGGVVVLHHPNNHRRMTAREQAAVQTFPDDFIFHGTKTSAYRQIANAVPPLLAAVVGKFLLQADELLTGSKKVKAA